jgi:hypothetical protein
MATAAKETPQNNPLTYDLALQVRGCGVAWTIRNRGITLSDERIDWAIDGRADAARLDSIVEVTLRTGGAWIEEGPTATCQIAFRDGYALIVSDANTAGFKDEAQARPYRDFVRDLHARLARCRTTARFTAGYGRTQFQVIAALAVLLAAMGIGIPVVLFFARPSLEILLLLGGGIGLTVPLFTMLLKNSPRSYEPTRIPAELLP